MGYLFEPPGQVSWFAQLAGAKRETARRKSMRRAVLNSSRGNQTRLELFGSEFDDWPAAIMQSMLDAA